MDAPIPSSSFELPCRVTEMSGARSESDESERALTCWPTERRGKIALQQDTANVNNTYLRYIMVSCVLGTTTPELEIPAEIDKDTCKEARTSTAFIVGNVRRRSGSDERRPRRIVRRPFTPAHRHLPSRVGLGFHLHRICGGHENCRCDPSETGRSIVPPQRSGDCFSSPIQMFAAAVGEQQYCCCTGRGARSEPTGTRAPP